MPRPTVAQLAYGSATVVLSTLAMLLLSQTSSGPGVGVIAMSAVILGLFVALSVPKPKQTSAPESVGPPGEAARERVRETAGP